MGLSLHQWVGKDATATQGSGTWLGAALRITQVTAIEMSSDKRLTVRLGSPGCHREQLPGEGRGLPFPGGKRARGAPGRWECRELGLLFQVLPPGSLGLRGAGDERVERPEKWGARGSEEGWK